VHFWYGILYGMMEHRKVVDLTEYPGCFDESVDQACPGSKLNEFDWTTEVAQQYSTTEEEAIKVMDVLPELRHALVQRRDATRGSGSRTANVLPPRMNPRPRPKRLLPMETRDNGRKPLPNAINRRSMKQLNDQPRMRERHQDDQMFRSYEGRQTPRDHLHLETTTAEYGTRNKKLKRQELSGNHFVAPYDPKNDAHRFETDRAHFDRDLFRRHQVLDALKMELEEKICRVDDLQRSLELRENKVKTNLREIEMSKVDLEERRSAFRQSVTASVERMSLERREYAHEVERLKTEFQNEMSLQMKALNAQLEMFEKDMKWRTQQLDDEREQLEAFALARTKELDSRDAAQCVLQQDIETRLSICVCGEKQLADAIRDFNVARAAKDTEQEALSKQLKEKQDDLKRAVDHHNEEVSAWTVMKLKQQEDLESRINEFESIRRSQQSALALQADAHKRIQHELDSREAALNKRSKELRVMRRELTNSSAKQVPKPYAIDVNQKDSKPVDYILIDSDDEARKPAENVWTSRAEAEPRQIPEQSKNSFGSASQKRRKAANDPYRFNYEENYNYSLSEETAFELQERLFREAAEKMRARATFQVASASNTKVDFQVSSPILDIADRHPNHWMWRDPYAVLGLPQQTPIHVVKSQFRRLARTYHPDKSGDTNTSAKFHAISSAYHKLVEKSCR
jgi:DnaJ domain